MKTLCTFLTLALVACGAADTGPLEPAPDPGQACVAQGGRWVAPGQVATWTIDVPGQGTVVYTRRNGTGAWACLFPPEVVPL